MSNFLRKSFIQQLALIVDKIVNIVYITPEAAKTTSGAVLILLVIKTIVIEL